MLYSLQAGRADQVVLVRKRTFRTPRFVLEAIALQGLGGRDPDVLTSVVSTTFKISSDRIFFCSFFEFLVCNLFYYYLLLLRINATYKQTFHQNG